MQKSANHLTFMLTTFTAETIRKTSILKHKTTSLADNKAGLFLFCTAQYSGNDKDRFLKIVAVDF